MSGLEGDSSDYFDNDLGDFIVVDDSDAAATSTDRGSPWPAKRRRLKADKQTSSRRKIQNDRHNTRESSDIASEEWDEELQSPYQTSHYFDGAPEPDAQSKYKLFVPKNRNVQENIFVTQLTQPQSPPEMIRGPRWKKPASEFTPLAVSPATRAVNGSGDGNRTNDDFDDDDALKAAIEASLQSFEDENSNKCQAQPPNNPQPPSFVSTSSEHSAEAMDVPEDFLNDIPDDAFDSDLSLSPSPPTHSRPVSMTFTQSANRPLGVRQTTLFDMTARSPANQPPRGEQYISPPEKVERPTQHRLNQGAMDTWIYPTNLGKTRDYQFNIAQQGLFHNLLVALPTGLGKTFIAATVMLNWFRWTQDAQIIFVAPTKPLVAQQIDACFHIAGIPRSQTTMLTGEAAPGIRAEEWKAKRVFFMTPQTLINDLKTGIADPKRIVLLVVDEAHRATGGYAYVEVVKFLRRYNQSFRVLALTATPGSTVEAVQAVIDGLDISRVEIRTEQSLDIREYVHAKDIEVQTFQNSEEMVLCMDLLTRTLQPLVDQLRSLNAYWGRDPMGLTAFGLTKARQQWMMSDVGRNAHFGLKGKVNAIFSVLASLAHGIDLLKYHGITPFYRHLAHFQSNTDGQKGGKYQRQVVQDESFKKLMNHLQPWTKNPEFIGHPKLEYLKQVVLNHFMDAGEGAGTGKDKGKAATRVMIFVHFRDSAEEVTRVLSRYEPMIRPHVFVGQSSAKGSEGMNQKTQLDIVQKFKSGTYNTIVATSIGEEGLDIGEVDLIVCYDSSASPIRMLQRMGRTGRKRAGNIVLLLMQGKEEESYIKAKDNYEKMQQMIASGTRFAFHEDQSPRILPLGVRPTANKRAIEIPAENTVRELPEPKRRGRAPKRPPKKFHMPDNVETGFTKASSLAEGGKRRGSKKSRARTPTPEPVEIPALEDVLLTSAQQTELSIHYGKAGQAHAPSIFNPRTDAFPRLQLTPRPIKAVQHGSLTRRMIGALQKMDRVSADCEQQYRRVLAVSLEEPQDTISTTCSSERLDKRSQRKVSDFGLPVKRRKNGEGIGPDGQPRTPGNQVSTVAKTADDSLFCSQMTDDIGEDFPDMSTLLDRALRKSGGVINLS
ncbi:3'-5' DNA helicase [Aspergillus saccharolyticus JOP 1030-1]|uniref:ATP-dependent DNA helicase n=1 Tax=Aspergillus saccharolyticus JOP 1030-1 TaxID=1450539 RepID=A0A319AET3_9EURO|nr:ATP-dependent DNA helicase mph1 [Aspergillus saccharolyticus JOP 1030-1]PYH49998.1 ATP-dependent DNA helicase mph1 [Aspergillus saccharolyticus JOP 1030-1]